MLREKEIFLVRLMKLTDALVIAVSFITAYFVALWIRKWVNLGPLAHAEGGIRNFLKAHFWLVIITIPAWIRLMSADGVYANFRTKLFIEICWHVLRTGVASLFILGSVVFLLKMELTSRMYVAMFAAVSLSGLFVSKAAWHWFLDYISRQGYNLTNMLIVGTGKRAQDFIRTVHAHANWGLRIVGLVDDDPKLLGKTVLEYPVIGRIRDIPRILRDHVVDQVIFVVPRMWLNRIEDAIFHCEREGVGTAVTVDLFKPKLGKLYISTFANIPMLVSQTASAKEWQLFLKRMTDVAISLLLVVVLSPVFIFATIGIKLDSKGPIFFRQVRSGRNGRKFTLYKFRSMYEGAEIRKRELERQNEMNGPVFKIRRDPRVTGFGRFMRKFSIDELPQFINVLKGDMSLVGPRPALSTEVEMYETWHRRRLSMKPGITCIWQVSGRNKIDFERWMEMDLKYIDNFSLWLDFKILVRTVFVVLTGYGAV
jgi:exopolysaccharide biosynthesis polyprenyl glycosylphosphotransferase